MVVFVYQGYRDTIDTFHGKFDTLEAAENHIYQDLVKEVQEFLDTMEQKKNGTYVSEQTKTLKQAKDRIIERMGNEYYEKSLSDYEKRDAEITENALKSLEYYENTDWKGELKEISQTPKPSIQEYPNKKMYAGYSQRYAKSQGNYPYIVFDPSFVPPSKEMNAEYTLLDGIREEFKDAEQPIRMSQEDLLDFFNSLKTNEEILVWYNSGIRSADDWTEMTVGRRSESKKYGVKKVALKGTGGGKFYLYNRKGRISLAMGDMATVLIAAKKRDVRNAETFESDQFPSMHYGDHDSDAQEKYQEFLDEWDGDDGPPSFEEWEKQLDEYDRKLQEYQDSAEYAEESFITTDMSPSYIDVVVTDDAGISFEGRLYGTMKENHSGAKKGLVSYDPSTGNVVYYHKGKEFVGDVENSDMNYNAETFEADNYKCNACGSQELRYREYDNSEHNGFFCMNCGQSPCGINETDSQPCTCDMMEYGKYTWLGEKPRTQFPSWLDADRFKKQEQDKENERIRIVGSKEKLDAIRKGAETFGVEFDDWAEQEMLTHGENVSFKKWAKEEGEKHGDVPITDWAQHEEESHDERYEAESIGKFEVQIKNDPEDIWETIGKFESLEDAEKLYFDDKYYDKVNFMQVVEIGGEEDGEDFIHQYQSFFADEYGAEDNTESIKSAIRKLEKALGKMDGATYKMHDLDISAQPTTIAGFEMSRNGEKYDGGSYLIMTDGSIVNAAMGNADYGNITDNFEGMNEKIMQSFGAEGILCSDCPMAGRHVVIRKDHTDEDGNLICPFCHSNKNFKNLPETTYLLHGGKREDLKAETFGEDYIVDKYKHGIEVREFPKSSSVYQKGRLVKQYRGDGHRIRATAKAQQLERDYVTKSFFSESKSNIKRNGMIAAGVITAFALLPEIKKRF